LNRCSTCRDWGKDESCLHSHIEEDVEGLLEPLVIQQNPSTIAYEEQTLEVGTIAYKYVQWSADLNLVEASQKIASKAQCLCINCIRYSLSFVPHYGDGAYCTLNEQLKRENPRIIHTHGIDIRAMDYRVVMKILEPITFKKISRTAGVVRSIPLSQQLYVGKPVLTDELAVKIICFQRWDGKSWSDILLEDLQGVS